MPPTRPLAVDYEVSTSETWNLMLHLDAHDPASMLSFSPSPSQGWSSDMPFDTNEFPFSITAQGSIIDSWGYWQRSEIIAEPPPSPVNCPDSCGSLPSNITLVPFGGTNIRIAVFPWTLSKPRVPTSHAVHGPGSSVPSFTLAEGWPGAALASNRQSEGGIA
eukprot:6193779-Pleurochrysis_carterae.AAC.4